MPKTIITRDDVNYNMHNIKCCWNCKWSTKEDHRWIFYCRNKVVYDEYNGPIPFLGICKLYSKRTSGQTERL
jgi:hypothetical protein